MYEYRCQKNRHHVTRFLKIAEVDTLQTCECGSELQLQYSVPQLKLFKPFITRNITADGSPVEVRSEGHQAELCRIHGVRPSPLRDYKLNHDRPGVQGSVNDVKDRLKDARRIVRQVSAEEAKKMEAPA